MDLGAAGSLALLHVIDPADFVFIANCRNLN
jgi:hypothetical protein